MRLMLPRTGKVLGTWILQEPINRIRRSHPELLNLVEEICSRHSVSHLYFSDWLGLSLDLLSIELPMTLVHHDLFPAGSRQANTSKPISRARRSVTASKEVQKESDAELAFWDVFCKASDRERIDHVSPSKDLIARYRRLEPRLADLDCCHIPFGVCHQKASLFAGAHDRRRLRVAILEPWSRHSQIELLERNYESIRSIVDVVLLGSGREGLAFENRWGTDLVYSYLARDLPEIVRKRQIDLVLSLDHRSVGFSYPLADSRRLGIPFAGNRRGLAREWISSGVDGFLFDLDDEGLIDFLIWIDGERSLLRRVAKNLREKAECCAMDAVESFYGRRPDTRRNTQ